MRDLGFWGVSTSRIPESLFLGGGQLIFTIPALSRSSNLRAYTWASARQASSFSIHRHARLDWPRRQRFLAAPTNRAYATAHPRCDGLYGHSARAVASYKSITHLTPLEPKPAGRTPRRAFSMLISVHYHERPNSRRPYPNVFWVRYSRMTLILASNSVKLPVNWDTGSRLLLDSIRTSHPQIQSGGDFMPQGPLPRLSLAYTLRKVATPNYFRPYIKTG